MGSLRIAAAALFLACFAASASAQKVHTSPNGQRFYFDQSGENIIYCGGHDADGKHVPCPSDDLPFGMSDCQSETNWLKRKACEAQQQFKKAKEKVQEVKDTYNLKVLDGFSSTMPPAEDCLLNCAGNTHASGDVHDSLQDSGEAAQLARETMNDAERFIKEATANIGRAGREKDAQERQEREDRQHRELIATLDKQEGRTAGTPDRSSYQAALDARVVPRETQGGTSRGQVRKRPPISGATYDCRPGSSLYTPGACARLGFAPSKKPTKSYAVQPTDYSKSAKEKKGQRAYFEYPKFGPLPSEGRRESRRESAPTGSIFECRIVADVLFGPC